MFYRRKILLALLQLGGGRMEKIRIQKLLMLFTRCQEKPEYDFVPFKYGCYSFSANADFTAMVRRNTVYEDETSFHLLNKDNYIGQLRPRDRELLTEILRTFDGMKNDELLRHTYEHYPLYAIKSEIAHKLSGGDLCSLIEKAKPRSNETTLFTIGYEGISLEQYLMRLIRKDVKLLVDARGNALSMKFGFSKSALRSYCEKVGISYLHIPSVGVPSELRKNLNTQADYDALFEQYINVHLKNTHEEQQRILDLLRKHQRIALTCFEADAQRCHRKPLADAIARLPGFSYKVIHL